MSTSIKKITAALDAAGIAAGDAQKKVSEAMREIDDVKKKLADIESSIDAKIKNSVLAPNESLRKGKAQEQEANVTSHITPKGPRG
jgi:flagellar motility protein MotE (MotC chaperone)